MILSAKTSSRCLPLTKRSSKNKQFMTSSLLKVKILLGYTSVTVSCILNFKFQRNLMAKTYAYNTNCTYQEESFCVLLQVFQSA